MYSHNFFFTITVHLLTIMEIHYNFDFQSHKLITECDGGLHMFKSSASTTVPSRKLCVSEVAGGSLRRA